MTRLTAQDCQDECKLPFDAHCHARDSGWFCTRKRGHDGRHVACGTHDHAFHVWVDTNPDARATGEGSMHEESSTAQVATTTGRNLPGTPDGLDGAGQPTSTSPALPYLDAEANGERR